MSGIQNIRPRNELNSFVLLIPIALITTAPPKPPLCYHTYFDMNYRSSQKPTLDGFASVKYISAKSGRVVVLVGGVVVARDSGVGETRVQLPSSVECFAYHATVVNLQ